MDELVQAIANYGTGVICVAYLIYFQSTTMREMLKTLESINTRLTKIEDKVGIED